MYERREGKGEGCMRGGKGREGRGVYERREGRGCVREGKGEGCMRGGKGRERGV